MTFGLVGQRSQTFSIVMLRGVVDVSRPKQRTELPTVIERFMIVINSKHIMRLTRCCYAYTLYRCTSYAHTAKHSARSVRSMLPATMNYTYMLFIHFRGKQRVKQFMFNMSNVNKFLERRTTACMLTEIFSDNRFCVQLCKLSLSFHLFPESVKLFTFFIPTSGWVTLSLAAYV